MAKRTAKKTPTEASTAPSNSSFQIPEVTPTMPSPWESLAASVPKLPTDGDVTASQVSAAKPKPSLPSGIHDFDPDEVPRDNAIQLDPSITCTPPAQSRLNVLGTDLLGDCATANKLGTLQPVKAKITFSDDNRWCFLMPVHHEADRALKITYNRKLACINLWKPFAKYGRRVERGFKETYALGMTDEPITIHGVKGYALYFDLASPDKQLVQEREESATERTTTGKTKEARTATKQAPTTEAPAPAMDLAEANEKIAKLHETLEKRDAALDERDAQIEEFEQRLHAYEEKYGKP